MPQQLGPAPGAEAGCRPGQGWEPAAGWLGKLGLQTSAWGLLSGLYAGGDAKGSSLIDSCEQLGDLPGRDGP